MSAPLHRRAPYRGNPALRFDEPRTSDLDMTNIGIPSDARIATVTFLAASGAIR